LVAAQLKTFAIAIMLGAALFCFASCAASTTAIGVTTIQDADKADNRR
jgi:hypothetical protein